MLATYDLLSRIFSLGKKKPPLREIKMCVLGLDNSGKTTILRALSREEIQNVMPTQGFNVKTLQNGNFKFNVWDLGGQKAIR